MWCSIKWVPKIPKLVSHLSYNFGNFGIDFMSIIIALMLDDYLGYLLALF